ncbi:hypothetical protein [Clostridium saudiense]|jgi:hypothetical protein|uniref:hypothetical protein n=1 Tax=Clostridium saudiense TaxID=1414720 RepID=UPI0012B8ACB1|nr:hypothetical protein [Clostridium saudiense]
MEVICIYVQKIILEEDNEGWKIKKGGFTTKKFDSYDIFGKWVADNAVEISIIDVIQKER